jgi:hypothetical protein
MFVSMLAALVFAQLACVTRNSCVSGEKRRVLRSEHTQRAANGYQHPYGTGTRRKGLVSLPEQIEAVRLAKITRLDAVQCRVEQWRTCVVVVRFSVFGTLPSRSI